MLRKYLKAAADLLANWVTLVAWLLHDAGLYVSVVNAMPAHDHGNTSLRQGKTDKKDVMKLLNYGLDHWLTLPRYIPELKNNLISLLDTTFPDANRLFISRPRTNSNEKLGDFVADFWHCERVRGLPETAFTAKYQKWCRKHSCNSCEDKALDIYAFACRHFCVMPKTDAAKLLVEQAISQLQTTSAALAALKSDFRRD